MSAFDGFPVRISETNEYMVAAHAVLKVYCLPDPPDQIMRSFLSGQGTNEDARRRACPLLTRWVDFGSLVVED